jgi:primosomal replication protein N
VNKVFLTGKIYKVPEVTYSPKGKKIAIFPLHIEEGDFTIQVIGSGDVFPREVEKTVGSSILVAGELVKAKLKTRDILRLKASKILWMEE